MKTMKKMCFKVNIEDDKGRRRILKCIAGIEGVESFAVDMKERKITVIGESDPVYLGAKLRKLGYGVELLSVGPAKVEKFSVRPAKVEKFSVRPAKAPKSVIIDTREFYGDPNPPDQSSGCINSGWEFYGDPNPPDQSSGCINSGWEEPLSSITENRGCNHYLGVQRVEVFGGNRVIEDSVGSKTRIVKAVAGFGDFTSIEVDIEKGMVTVVGKSVPVSVALKVREMGYRAKLLSLGPATEEEDPDEEHNDDLYPSDEKGSNGGANSVYEETSWGDGNRRMPCFIFYSRHDLMVSIAIILFYALVIVVPMVINIF